MTSISIGERDSSCSASGDDCGLPGRAAETVHMRGAVANLDGSTLTVKTREGATESLTLKPGWKVTGVANASLGDIKPGDFVGVASLPRAAGGDGAIEVLVFPAAMKGTGEGSYPWDLKPNSTMTNATRLERCQGCRRADPHPLLQGRRKEDFRLRTARRSSPSPRPRKRT